MYGDSMENTFTDISVQRVNTQVKSNTFRV